MNNEKYKIVKFVDDEFKLDVNVSPNENTVWLSRQEISLLFDRDRTVINRHIKNIFTKELDKKAKCIFCTFLILISLLKYIVWMS